jgi:hypothetical protein
VRTEDGEEERTEKRRGRNADSERGTVPDCFSGASGSSLDRAAPRPARWLMQAEFGSPHSQHAQHLWLGMQLSTQVGYRSRGTSAMLC